MPVKYNYNPSLNIVYTRPYRELSSLEIDAYFNKIINDGEVKNGFVEVVNFEDVENFLFSSNEASKITSSYNKLKDKKKIRATIFIGKLDIHYGFARMMQILHEINDPNDDVFTLRSEEEANHIIKDIIG